jgi:cytochrome P450
MQPLPKGPSGRVLANLQSVHDPLGSAERWRRRYGDPMIFPGLDGQPSLLSGSPEASRALFTAPADTFQPFGAEQLAPVIGESSLLLLAEPRHGAMRRLLMPPFHGQRMRLYGQQIRDLTLQQLRGVPSGTSLVVQDLMHAISLQLIIHLVFGVTAPSRVAEVMQRIRAFRESLSPGLLLAMLLPCLRREFFGLGPWARLQRALRGMRATLGQQIAESRQAGDERTDILSLLLAARFEDGSALDEQQIFEQLQTLLLAGHSTTAVALSWALYFLAQEPRILARLRLDLAALGPDPSPEAVARTPLLEAVCHETLRLRPALSAVMRRLQRPLRVLDYDLPAGMGVGALVLWLHQNPQIYPEPERFWPERFLGKTYSPFEYVPFGGGHRRCVGAALALYEMKLVLGTLLPRYDFELLNHKPVRVALQGTLVPGAPIRMRVRPVASPA